MEPQQFDILISRLDKLYGVLWWIALWLGLICVFKDCGK